MAPKPKDANGAAVKPAIIFRYKLSAPLKAYGNDVAELEFRKPTAFDIMNIGDPVVLDIATDPPRVTFDAPKMFAMMSTLASVPMSSLSEMDTNDWVACAWGISPFFVPRPGTI